MGDVQVPVYFCFSFFLVKKSIQQPAADDAIPAARCLNMSADVCRRPLHVFSV